MIFDDPMVQLVRRISTIEKQIRELFLRLSGGGASGIPTNGWISVSDTWTRTGNHSFTIPGDVTSTYRKGAKVRYQDGGGVDEYGVIFSSVFGAVTTINLIPNTDFTMAAAAITNTYISYIQNPEGFPNTFNYSATWNNLTGNGTYYAKWQADGVHFHNRAGFIFGNTTAITGTLNLVPVATPSTLGTTQEHFGETTIRDTGTALYNGTAYLIGGNIYPQVSAASGAYSAPSNITATVPMTWVNTDEISIDCSYDF